MMRLGYAVFGLIATVLPLQVAAEGWDAHAVVERALAPTTDWPEPAPRPQGQPGKNVVYLAASLRNGGILAVGEGLREASEAIGWTMDILDARGEARAVDQALTRLLETPPDALVVGGFDAKAHAEALNALAETGTEIVARHAGPASGPIAGTPVKLNITTDPLEVAKVAAAYAIQITDGAAGAVVFTDARYGIDLTKSDEMARVIDACGGCEVLEIVNLKLDETQRLMPETIERLLAAYGDR